MSNIYHEVKYNFYVWTKLWSYCIVIWKFLLIFINISSDEYLNSYVLYIEIIDFHIIGLFDNEIHFKLMNIWESTTSNIRQLVSTFKMLIIWLRGIKLIQQKRQMYKFLFLKSWAISRVIGDRKIQRKE